MTAPGSPVESGGKVLALFGAGPGLGAALGRRFGRDGYRVALIARRREPIDAIAADLGELGLETDVFPADLARVDEIPSVVEAIRDRFGRIDAVAYAPITRSTPFLPATDLDRETLAHYVDLYLYSPIAVVNAVLPEMLDRGDGAILLGHGATSINPEPGRSGISTVMAAARHYVYSLHAELADRGVYVGTLAIGALIRGSTGAAALSDEVLDRLTGTPPVEPDVLAELAWTLIRDRSRIEATWPPSIAIGNTQNRDD